MLGLNTLVQNRYLVKNLIGRGGMGAVYLAEDTRFSNRKVALKEMLFTNNPKLEAAFGREANLLAQLNHRGLPKVSDYFNDRGFQYLVMEYVPGDDLETLLKKIQSPFPYKRVLNWADSLLDILEYLHTQNPPVLHRDIKPQNLKLTPDDKIILLDFGLAKDSVATQMQSANSLAGFTPNYAPLEQIEGSQATMQTDIYLFSATIYHLLTNNLPASSLNRIQAKMDNRNDPLFPAHQLNPEVPAKFSAFLAQGLNLKREDRPMSAREMRQRLREIANESATVSKVPTEQMNLHNQASEQRNIQTAIFPMQPEHIQPTSFQPVNNVQPVQESVQTIAFQPVQENPQTVAFVPPPTPAATQVAVEPPKSFVSQNPQNSQPVFTEPKKSRRGIFLSILVALIFLLGAGGVGAYFIAQKFLVKSDTTTNKNTNTKTSSETEKKSDGISSTADAGSKDANSNSNANTAETVKEDTEKPTEKKNVETKTVVPQQKQVQKTTVPKPVKPVKQNKQSTKPSGGGGGIYQ